jgi:ubiquinone/menaquinone biosynthesis C-methylase UbiE
MGSTISIEGLLGASTVGSEIERSVLNKLEEEYQENKSSVRESLAEALTKAYKAVFKPSPVERQTLADAVAVASKGKILEEGAGNDTMYQLVQERTTPDRYIRSDLSENQLNQVDAVGTENLVYNGSRHDLQDGDVDITFSKCVLHHIDNGSEEGREKNRIDYLKEQQRIVRPGGVVITMDVVDPSKGNLKSKFWHNVKHRLILGEEEHHFLTTDGAMDLYRKAGFENITGQEVETYKGTYFMVSGQKCADMGS